MTQIGNEFLRRLQTNMQFFCPACERIVPVFNNLQNYVPPSLDVQQQQQGRRLLQTSAIPPGVVAGTISVMLVYKTNVTTQSISLADVQRAVYDTGYDALNFTIDPASLSKLVDSLKNNQFILGTLQVMQTAAPTSSQ